MRAEETALERSLGQLLDELGNTQEELLVVLRTRREALAANDLERLQDQEDVERQLQARLEACHRRRGELLEEARRGGLPCESLDALLRHVERATTSGRMPHPLRPAYAAVAQRTSVLQHESLTNWIVAHRSLLHATRLLEIVATGGRVPSTYGIRKPSPQFQGALLDRDA